MTVVLNMRWFLQQMSHATKNNAPRIHVIIDKKTPVFVLDDWSH